MQNTLLGLAIALILALVVALVGPLVVDWGTYRSVFESQASHLVGVPVRVTGSIDARLLPAPHLTLNNIEIGDGAGRVRARSLDLELALGPLMRGEWRASDMTLSGPEVTLSLDAARRITAPGVAVSFDPEALTIDRLNINEGKLTLADAANGSRVTFENVWFNGEVKSLLGPFKGEGAVTLDGELYPYRLSAGRYSDDPGLKFRLNIDPVARPLAIELDGALALNGGAPRFEGNVALTRPVGILRGTHVTQPWKITSKVKATAQSALLQNLEYQYGSEEQGLKLTGVADIAFGARPRLEGVLSSRQIDLDRTLGEADGRKLTPAAALRSLIETGAGVFKPAIPVKLGVGIDQVTLGGNTVQNLRGDVSSHDGGWSLDSFEFRAPGFTQVKLSGRLAVEQDHVSFTGPAEIRSNDPRVLTAWLEGRDGAGQGEARPLNLRGDVTVGTERIGVESLTAEFDRKTVSGRLAYFFATAKAPARLDAALNAPELDFDGVLAFGKALVAGSKLERPQAMTISADVGRATVAGFTGRNASAQVKVDGDGVEINKLAVADLGGAAFSAQGRIVTSGTPQGSVRVDLDAPDVKPVLALLSRLAPETARALEPHAMAMAPARLRGTFSLTGPQAATQGRIELTGRLGKVQLALNGQGRVDAAAYTAGDIQVDGKLSADEGPALVAMLGLDNVVAVAPGAGSLAFKATGAARGTMRVEGQIVANGLEASVNGTATPFTAEPVTDVRLTIAKANAAPLRGAPTALPVTYASRVQLAGKALTLSDINASVNNANVRGKLAIALSELRGVQGDLEVDALDAGTFVGAAIGMPAPVPTKSGAWTWSSEPFAEAMFGDFVGRVALKAHRVDLLPRAVARSVEATLVFDRDVVTIEDISGALAGGKIGGELSLRDDDDGIKLDAKLALTGVDASALLPAGPRPPVTGNVDMTANIKGSGLSPIALIGSLQGDGSIVLSGAQFAGLDPHAFDALAQAVDQGLTLDNARIADTVRRALDSGQLSVPRAQSALALAAGQVRLSNLTADSKDAALAVSGSFDLTDGSLDGRVVLSGTGQAAGTRPDVFMALGGTVVAPTRSIDVSALSGWLTLRAVEKQAKRLQAIEHAAPVVESPRAQDRSQEKAQDKAPALPPPLAVSPVPAPRSARPDNSLGAQN